MAAKQTAMLMGRLVEHQEHFNSLPTIDAQWAIQNPKEAVVLCVTAIKSRINVALKKAERKKTERTYKILWPVIISKPVEDRPFKADNTFFNKKSGVKMSHSSSFVGWFMGKVEEDVPEGMLVPFALSNSAYDNEIIIDLGGEEKAEVFLSEIWRLMERQANGQGGVLLTNGRANTFYVRDREGELRTVRVSLSVDDGDWATDAFAIDDNWRSTVDRIFSRNS